MWSELIFDWISGEVLEEWREEGAASAGSEEVLVEWREEGAAPVGSEEGVVPAEWKEKMQGLQEGVVLAELEGEEAT